MTDETQRIPVPKNGRKPKPVKTAGAADAADATVTAEPAAAEPAAIPVERRGVPAAAGAAVPRDQTVGFTPNQLAAGFGIVAGLLLLFFGARRRRGGKGSDE